VSFDALSTPEMLGPLDALARTANCVARQGSRLHTPWLHCAAIGVRSTMSRAGHLPVEEVAGRNTKRVETTAHAVVSLAQRCRVLAVLDLADGGGPPLCTTVGCGHAVSVELVDPAAVMRLTGLDSVRELRRDRFGWIRNAVAAGANVENDV
jgi:hypothetical protein